MNMDSALSIIPEICACCNHVEHQSFTHTNPQLYCRPDQGKQNTSDHLLPHALSVLYLTP